MLKLTKKDFQDYSVKLVAECFATCILILIGEGGIANYKFARQPTHSTLPISLSFAVGVYSALMIAGSISGAHLNPAVSISLLTIKKMKPIQCLFYVIGQILGAFFGAVLVYTVYRNQFNEFDGGIRQMTGPNGTADIFFTMPGKGISYFNTFIDQVISTSLLMIYIMAITHKKNHLISEVAKPFAFVLIIIGITSAFSVNAGAALNPARDLGPRLFGAFLYGWSETFINDEHYFFFIPIIGPIVGAILGVWIYVGYIWIINSYLHSHKHPIQNDLKDIELEDKKPLETRQKV